MSDPDRRQLMEWLSRQSREPERDFQVHIGEAVMRDEPEPQPQYEVGEAQISQIGDERFDPPIPESAYTAWRGPIGQHSQPSMSVEIGEPEGIREIPQGSHSVAFGDPYDIQEMPQDAWAELESNPAAEQSERFRRR